MSQIAYKVVVVSGNDEGAEFFLTKRITRLGSDAGCDIQIAGEAIPPHTLSIDTGGGQIVVFNRAEVPLTIAGQALAALASMPWKPGKTLILPGQVQLRLESYAVNVPVVAPNSVKREEYDHENADAAKKVAGTSPHRPIGAKSTKNNVGPIIFIVACLVLVLLMIAKKLSGDGSLPSVAAGQTLNWEKVWIELTKEPYLGDHRYVAIRNDLMRLYRLQNSPDSTDAPQWKSRVLQSLMSNDLSEAQDPDFAAQLRAFVIKIK